MQRKPGFPVANCSIKMPDGMPVTESVALEEDGEQAQRRQQLINFGHTQWGFNNWSWSVTKQDLDFVDFANGKYCAGVVAFVSITVKSLDIHRENIGYATSLAPNKGSAIYKSRKCAVTNALRETLLSFGGSVATELTELLEPSKSEYSTPAPDPLPENNPNVANTLPHTAPSTLANLPSSSVPTVANSNAANNAPVKPEVKNIKRKDSEGSVANVNGASVVNSVSGISVKPRPAMAPGVKNQAAPPVARAQPMPAPAPAARPLAAVARAPAPRPNSNVSFVLQPVMPPLYAPPPRLPPPHAPPHVYPNYYEYAAGPWHFTYESYDRNVNLNFNLPPKNLVVNGRPASDCKNACRAGPEGEPVQYAAGPPNQGCWIKPTIFYDGFWTEQKVKKWVAEQVEKQFPEDASQKSSSPSNGQADPSAPKS